MHPVTFPFANSAQRSRSLAITGNKEVVGAGVYKKLTGKNVVFEFPVQEAA